MKRHKKVGEAGTAGQISGYSLTEKMQGPIPSAGSMIHIRGSLPRPGHLSLAFDIVPGWQFPGQAQHQLGQSKGGNKKHGALLHRLEGVQSLGQGKREVFY